MTTFAYFNGYGDCLYTIEAVEPPAGGIGIADGVDPATIWRDPMTGNIEAREPCPVMFADSYEVGEEIDFSLPSGAVALIDGEKVTGRIAFSAPRRFGLQIVGRYRLEKIISIVSYSEQRAAAYPPIREQLDMLYHDPQAWRAAVAAVKAAYPKPEDN